MFQEKNLAKRRLLQATYAQRNLRFRLAHFSYWYNDFGEVTENKADSYSSFDNELQYTGAVYDDSTGLLYLNARFYDPQTGRFISRDTYRGEPDNAGTWHLYAYCANNPVNYVDPSGHLAISAGAIAAASAAMIAATAHMNTSQFKHSWRDFCTTVGNGLSSIGEKLRKGIKSAWNGTKAYVNKISENVKAYNTAASAQTKIKEKSKQKKQKYFSAYMHSAGGYDYVAIGSSLSFNSAKSRVRRQGNVLAINKQYAKRLANQFSGVEGPEIDKGKAGIPGYYYHYHIKNRKSRVHIWYANY